MSELEQSKKNNRSNTKSASKEKTKKDRAAAKGKKPKNQSSKAALKDQGSAGSKPKYRAEELVFAMDIGTHSVIGMVGKKADTKMEVLEICEREYPIRAMLDGQIQDIDMVAQVAEQVKAELESMCRLKLKDVYVAAAGRTLRTVESRSITSFDEPTYLNDDIITKINSAAIAQAEKEFMEEGSQQNQEEYYLSGYSIAEYVIDGYPMPNIREHQGKVIEARAIVTFLPRQVVESLYTTMTKIGLEVAGLTLEPIAAMNSAIPQSIRLLNLALVDVGAGTSDIAISRDGSVVGYTMVTTAGDEITEAIMKKLLIDFDTAEEIKLAMSKMEESDSLSYMDILAMEHEISYTKLKECILESETQLAEEISKAILSVNSVIPSAVFLVGGGSRLRELNNLVAKALGMDSQRVALGGNNFEKTAFSQKHDIKNPAYATALGILLSAGFNMNNEGFFITLNGKKCRLFRSGTITVFDILMMNGYSHRDLFARKGDPITIYLNGKRRLLFGEMSAPASIMVNDKEAKATTIVAAGDRIDFTPATQGSNAKYRLADILRGFEISAFKVNLDGEKYTAGSFAVMDGRELTDEKELNTPIKNDSRIDFISIKTVSDFKSYYKLNGYLAIEETETDDELFGGCSLYYQEMPEEYNDGSADILNENKEPATNEAALQQEQLTESAAELKGADINEEIADTTKDGETKPDEGSVGSDAEEPAHTEVTADEVSDVDNITFFINGERIAKDRKPNDSAYRVLDILSYAGVDLQNPKKALFILVNDVEAGFSTELKNNDRIGISWID